MQHFSINYVALLVAAITRFILGGIWYSPVLFGKPWQGLTRCSPEEMKARLPKIIPADLISSYIIAFVLVHAVHYAGATTAGLGAAVGFFNWLGFVAMTTLMATLYEKRPFKLFLITNGFQLLSLLLMGAIVAVWV
ncbi:MAG: DUF1761 domain-containing protein [Acidobacteria bacterium]|nr:DUF1761 domain-containing protein [Acidobacteriota bacterium]